MMHTNNTHKIAIIGPPDTVSGLASLGVEAFPATNAEETIKQLETIKIKTVDEASGVMYAVVCILEGVMGGIDEEAYSRLSKDALPAIVILPGPEGSAGHAQARLRKLAEQAVGSAII